MEKNNQSPLSETQELFSEFKGEIESIKDEIIKIKKLLKRNSIK